MGDIGNECCLEYVVIGDIVNIVSCLEYLICCLNIVFVISDDLIC